MTIGEPLLSLRDIGKDYPRVSHAGSRFRTVFDLLRGKGTLHHYCALSDISFSLRQGESLAIIGENGAGKSTLLKIIAKVIRPSRGEIKINGKVSALLELGSGFHAEYTGLENIDLAAALLGLSQSEIREKREQIIAFADIGEHISQPLKHYSSGMVVRLGFAIATVLEPDILITDEVLAVGDESFQKKCVAWMERFLARNGTLLLCSHNTYHVQKLCKKALWLQHGRARLYGDVNEVTQAYLAFHEEKAAQQRKQSLQIESCGSAGLYGVEGFSLSGEVDDGESVIRCGEDLEMEGVILSPDGRNPIVAIGFERADGTPVYGVMSDMDGYALRQLDGRRFAFGIRFPALQLLPGKYKVRAHAMDPEGMRLFDTIEKILMVKGETRELGLCHLPHQWSAESTPR